MSCPLCHAPGTVAALPEPVGKFRACPVCGLVFVARAYHPTLETERARYETHNNCPDDEGYRGFLDRTLTPMVARLDADLTRDSRERRTISGLDFGCGPGPTVEVMLSERGLDCVSYDPLFATVSKLLDESYDFVVATEVVEHFREPAKSWALLDRLLKPGGWLAVCTEVLTPQIDFTTWWYRRDLTHICFYRPETMAWIASRFGWSVESPGRTVRLFQKRF